METLPTYCLKALDILVVHCSSPYQWNKNILIDTKAPLFVSWSTWWFRDLLAYLKLSLGSSIYRVWKHVDTPYRAMWDTAYWGFLGGSHVVLVVAATGVVTTFSELKWHPDLAGSACDHDLRTLVPFRECLLVRGSKRPGSDIVCYTKPLDSLKNWNGRFFWVDAFAWPASFPWNTNKGVPKDPFPRSSKFNADHFNTLVALPAPFHKYPEPFLCLVGIRRYYTLDEDAYPERVGMDLLAFIQTADPTKVRVAETQHAKDEPMLLESTVRHVVPLLPIAPARASSELEASVDKLFDEVASGDGGDADVRPVVVTIDTIVEDVAPLQPRRQRKRKTVVADAGGPSRPPKKLREDYGALGGASTAESGDRSPADSVPGLNLRTIGAPQRFVISSDSSHHSGANIADAEVDSIIRSSALAIATVTTVTAVIDTEATTTRAPVAPSLFDVGSSSTGRTDSVPGVFSDVSGSDFRIGGIRTVVDPDSDLQKVYLSLNTEVRMRAEHNIREKRKLRVVVDEQEELLKAKDGEIESLKAQLLLKEAEAAEAIRLRADVFKFKSAEQSIRSEVGVLRDQNTALEREKNELHVKVTDLSASVRVREQEVADLDAQVTVVKLQNDDLVSQVHELEISSTGLPEKIAAYEGFVSQLEKFQDEKLEECLNSTEYLSALGAAITRAVEKGMQEGLAAGITHGAEGRQLADVAAYNPYAKADYLSALQYLQNVNFSLIAELKSYKDASFDTIMNIFRLDEVLVERLGLTESQHHVNQLMVPIHHSPDQRVVGAFAISLSLEVSHSRVKKLRENIANHVSAICGVFVPLSEPPSDAALEGMEGTSGSTHDAAATLSTTFVSTVPFRLFLSMIMRLLMQMVRVVPV
nr:hypothetical protein [Tanacetum cinerariifolium]